MKLRVVRRNWSISCRKFVQFVAPSSCMRGCDERWLRNAVRNLMDPLRVSRWTNMYVLSEGVVPRYEKTRRHHVWQIANKLHISLVIHDANFKWLKANQVRLPVISVFSSHRCGVNTTKVTYLVAYSHWCRNDKMRWGMSGAATHWLGWN